MNYQQIIEAINAAIGDGQAQINLMTSPNLATITKCLSKTYTEQFQNARRPDQLQAEYLTLRSNLQSAGDSTGVLSYWSPTNLFVAKYGQEYEEVHDIYVAKFTALAYADPDTEANNALQDHAIDLKDLQNIENASAC